jgi:MFS family permease
MLGGPISLSLGYLLVGWLNEWFGWRMTFMLLALPGFFAALLAWRTVREPRVEAAPIAAAQDSQQPGFTEVVVTLWKSATFRHLLWCHAVWYFFGFGLLQWQPAFFIRSHGLSTGEIGTWFSVIYGITGVAVYFGGELAARYAADNERLQLRACAWAMVFFAVTNPIAYLLPNANAAMGVLAFASLGHAVLGPILASVQTLVPPRMRAMALAIIYLFANLIGLGLGPLAAGAFSDALQPTLGTDSLRYALVILCPGHLWAGWHLWRASQTIGRDLAAMNAGYAAHLSGSSERAGVAEVTPGLSDFGKRGAPNVIE